MGESFGGCLALRVASKAPHLIARLALVNPATCFNASLGGVSSLVAATNLLSIFPKPLYEVRSLRGLRTHKAAAFTLQLLHLLPQKAQAAVLACLQSAVSSAVADMVCCILISCDMNMHFPRCVYLR